MTSMGQKSIPYYQVAGIQFNGLSGYNGVINPYIYIELQMDSTVVTTSR